MTSRARITQADMARAIRCAREAVREDGKSARVIFRLDAGEIEVILGGPIAEPSDPLGYDPEEWSDDDI